MDQFKTGDFNNNLSITSGSGGDDDDAGFARQVGMHFSQIHAQKILGPPYDHEGPAPSTGCEVYVRNLPLDPQSVFPDLYDVFKEIGKIYQIRLLVNFSGFLKGFGFVVFYSRSDAEKAIIAIQGHYLRPDKPLHVQLSVDNHILTISNLPGDKSDEDIVAEVKSIAGEDVEEVKVHRVYCAKSKSVPTTTCTIFFGSHRGASNSRRDFLSGKSKLWGQSVLVNWAPCRNEGGSGQQPRQNIETRPKRPRTSYRKF